MDIITKPKHNAIFWRGSEDEPWEQAELDELVLAYEKQDYCELEYWTIVHNIEGKELYSLSICSGCGQVVVTLDKKHDLTYCPYCGRRIVR